MAKRGRPRGCNAHGLIPSYMDILRMKVDGLSNAEIAERRDIKKKSIDTSMRMIGGILLYEEYRPRHERIIEYAREHIFKEERTNG